MIDFKNISKTFGGEYILKDVNCRVNTGERVGVVGPNGAGKSTLFNMIIGEIMPDSGEIIIPRDFRLGVMRQYIADTDRERTLLEFTADAIPELKSYSAELEALEHRLDDAADDDPGKEVGEGEDGLQRFLVAAHAQLIEHQRQNDGRRETHKQHHRINPDGHPEGV